MTVFRYHDVFYGFWEVCHPPQPENHSQCVHTVTSTVDIIQWLEIFIPVHKQKAKSHLKGLIGTDYYYISRTHTQHNRDEYMQPDGTGSKYM